MIKNAVQLFVSKEAAESCLHRVFILTKYKWLYARISGILAGSNIASLASLMYVYTAAEGHGSGWPEQHAGLHTVK